jgi:DNA-binding NarL/FixJ family response regulator
MDYPALTRPTEDGRDLSPMHSRGEPTADALRTKDVQEYSAVRLFATAARRAQPGFELAAGNLADVVRICHLVEGIPLALLLAAAWVEMLTPAEIAAEISVGISDELEGQMAGSGLDFLSSDLRDAPERQRSMRAVFEHSWMLLAEDERAVMRALSVFRGSFTREAARAVAGASLRELMALVDKSLLQRTPTGRFALHELLRQYAEEQLKASGAAGEVRGRHSRYYMNALYRHRLDLTGRPQEPAAPLTPRAQAAAAAPSAHKDGASTASQPLVDPLTGREMEVLALIAAGLSNQEIAERLTVALSTVKKHINRIYDKLGVKRRTQAIVRAKELYLL